MNKVFGEAAKAFLGIQKQKGGVVFLKDIYPTNPGDCPNCGGLGYHWFQLAKSGPTRNPMPKGTNAYIEGEGWYSVESCMYPCPICSSRTARFEQLWERSGLLLEERGWKLDFLIPYPGKTEALNAARSILAQVPSPKGLYFVFGGYGTGKSGLGKSLVAACVWAGVQARYVRAEDFLNELRASYGENAGDQEIRDAYISYNLLVVDEIDRTSKTDWAKSAMMVLIDERYRRREQCATVLISNLGAKELEAQGMGYLTSRLKDAAVLTLAGADLRGQK